MASRLRPAPAWRPPILDNDLGQPPEGRHPSAFADPFAPARLPDAVPYAAVDAAGPIDWPPVPTGLFPLAAPALPEFTSRSAADPDAYYVPRDRRFETTFIFAGQPIERPPLIFADALTLPSATGGSSLALRAAGATVPEPGEIQSPTLTILFSGLVITFVLLFVYLVAPLLR